MIRILPARGVVLLGLCAVLWAGCGYSTSLRAKQVHKSVGIEFFGNDSYERDLERPFQDEMTRALRNLTDVAVEEPSKAEVVVRGKIRTYHRRGGIRSPDNVLLETGVTIDVEAKLYPRDSDVPLREAQATVAVGYLVDSVDPQQDQANELEARDRALRHIAEELVLDLFAPVK